MYGYFYCNHGNRRQMMYSASLGTLCHNIVCTVTKLQPAECLSQSQTSIGWHGILGRLQRMLGYIRSRRRAYKSGGTGEHKKINLITHFTILIERNILTLKSASIIHILHIHLEQKLQKLQINLP